MRDCLRIAALLLALLATDAALAQRQTSTMPTTSRGTFLKLTGAQELWEEERYTDAQALLRELAAKVADNPYEFALVHQYLANTSILAGDTDGARAAVERALAVTELPVPMRANLSSFYGQLLVGEQEFEAALPHLEYWYENAEGAPAPSQIFYVAYANYMVGKLPRAQVQIERAIAEVDTPNEQWERVYYQILFDQKLYDRALGVVLGMLERQPAEDGYWRLLANHFVTQEESRRALAALVIANLQNPMTEPVDLRRLVSLYGLVEIPEKAARLLQDYLADERLPSDPETLRQLGELWLLARERARAKTVLEDAAQLAPDGRTYRLLAGIFFEDEDWDEAFESYEEALRLGGLKDAAQVELLAGITAFRAGRPRDARPHLEAAAESEDYREQAEMILQRL
mgnify:CR=1 FL=1